jgi:hypothetical protein
MICVGFKNRDFSERSLCEVAFEILVCCRLDSNIITVCVIDGICFSTV